MQDEGYKELIEYLKKLNIDKKTINKIVLKLKVLNVISHLSLFVSLPALIVGYLAILINTIELTFDEALIIFIPVFVCIISTILSLDTYYYINKLEPNEIKEVNKIND